MITSNHDNKNFTLLLAAIAIAALVMRVWGMWFGLPLLLDPDEPVFVGGAMHMGSHQTLNPKWFGHPGNVSMYLMLAEFLGYYLLGRTLGWFENAEAFGLHFQSDPTVFYLLGRSISVVFGVLCVIAIGKLGKRLLNERAGLMAALFLAFEPFSVSYSKHIRGDMLGTFFIILAVLYGLKFWDERRPKHAVISSLAIGVATGAKYPFASAGIVTLLLAIFLGLPSAAESLSSRVRWKKALTFLTAHSFFIVLAFFCVTPFFFLDFGKAWHDLMIEGRGQHLGHESESLLKNFWWYLTNGLHPNTGLPLLAGAGLGLLFCASKPDKRKILVMAFPVTLFFILGAGNMRWTRYLVPLMPFVCLFAAFAAEQLVSRIFSPVQNSSLSRRVTLKVAIQIGVIAILVCYPFKESLALNRRFCLPDTRQSCLIWVRENIPSGKFAQEFYTFQPFARYAYLMGEFRFENYAIEQHFSLAEKTLAEYRTQGFTHLLVSNTVYDRYLQDVERFPHEAQFYDELFALEPLKTFEAAAEGGKGPRIVIYALGEHDE